MCNVDKPSTRKRAWLLPHRDSPRRNTPAGFIASGCHLASKADTQDFYSASFLCASLRLGGSCLLYNVGQLRTSVVPRYHHCPIGAPGRRAFHIGNTDTRGMLHQEVSSVSRRIDPLVECFREAVIAVRDVLCCSARARRANTGVKSAEDIVIESVLCCHRRGLLVGNTRECRIQRYSPLPVL